MLIISLCGMIESTQATVIVPADSIRAQVLLSLQSFADRHGAKIEAEIPALASIQVPCDVVSEIRMLEPDETVFRRRMKLHVELLDGNGELAKRIFVAVRVKHFVTVAVATDDIRPDSIISNGNIEFREMDVTLRHGWFSDESALSNTQSRKRIPAGTILTNSHVELIPLVKRGDLVTVQSCVGSVLVTAVGTAREDGSLNETIRVFNKTTRRTLNCQVVSDTTVRINGQGGIN